MSGISTGNFDDSLIRIIAVFTFIVNLETTFNMLNFLS